MKPRIALLVAGVVVAGSTAVATGQAFAATTGCRVDYGVSSQWAGGFQADVTITNLGDPVTSWSLGFDFLTATQGLTQGWNATWRQVGAHVTADNMSYNGALAQHGSVSIGFTGTWSATNPPPASFMVNGVACTGDTDTPPPSTPPTTTPPPTDPPPTDPPAPAGSAPVLHVAGNKLLTAAGATYRLLGVNRSGGEFACIQNNGFWNGPMDQASIDAMRAWRVRAVRVPLNEECWLGTADVPPAFGGAAYQDQVKAYVDLLVRNGITPIVEMHWNFGAYSGNSAGCPDVKATCQKPMPDAQFAPSFWTGVANAFKDDNAVVFDLFNEPFPERATGNATTGWRCWRDGGTCPGIGYQVAGFQSLVNAVRATGSTNVVMVGGLAFSNDLSQWLQFRPTDPAGQLMAFAHIYNFNACANTACWDSQLAPVAAQVPLALSEIGENDCAHQFIDTVMNWADAHGVGYLGWTWNNWDCRTGPSLISDYGGTATPFGQGFKDRLAQVSS